MEEKIIVQTEKFNPKNLKIKKVAAILAVITFVVLLLTVYLPGFIDSIDLFNRHECRSLCDYGDDCWLAGGRDFNSAVGYAFYIMRDMLPIVIGIPLGAYFVALFVYWAVCKLLKNIELTLTNKRVFGCNAFGKRVDLPIDSIAAVGIGKLFHSVIITTASGAIRFSFLTQYQLFHQEINKLLIDRQDKKANSQSQTIEVKSDEADQLKKYKDLLDSGVITQEEFDQKKKQLLGL